MKAKRLITIIMILACLNVFGQQAGKESTPKNDSQKELIQNLQSIIDNQQKMILQLSADNQSMQKQIVALGNDVERYREDVRANVSEMNTNMTLWFGVLTLVMAILGVAVPLILNQKNEKNVEKLLEDTKKEAKEAKEQAQQAKQAVANVEGLKEQVSKIQDKINEDIISAEKAANRAKASELFAQALSEKNKNKAIELYNKSIELNPYYVDAFNNRGVVKYELENYKSAIDDYNKAIELDSNYSMAYNNKAFALMKIGELNKALDVVNDALLLNGNEYAYWDTKGEILLNMDNYNEAIRMYTKALSLNNDSEPSLLNRAICYRQLAESEQDPAKQADFIAKAEADEEKAKSLRDK